MKYNGAAFDKAKFPKLAAVYPSGVLPDLRGVFIRGWDDGRGLDSGRTILSFAADKMRKHTHALLFGNGDGGETPAVHEYYRKSSESTYFAYSGSSGVYLSEEGQNETAPSNVTFNYIVRAA
nr:phage tail protein [Enterobacter hormaechei]